MKPNCYSGLEHSKNLHIHVIKVDVKYPLASEIQFALQTKVGNLARKMCYNKVHWTLYISGPSIQYRDNKKMKKILYQCHRLLKNKFSYNYIHEEEVKTNYSIKKILYFCHWWFRCRDTSSDPLNFGNFFLL